MQKVSLNSKEQLKLDVITKVIQGKLSRRSAQQILAVSERSLRRYIKDFQENGPLFVKHKNWANVPANKTLSVLKEEILNIALDKYFDFNRKHAWEKITEDEGLPIGYHTFNR